MTKKFPYNFLRFTTLPILTIVSVLVFQQNVDSLNTLKFLQVATKSIHKIYSTAFFFSKDAVLTTSRNNIIMHPKPTQVTITEPEESFLLHLIYK
ncbi:hypothetical protein DIS07_00890 [Polaribacter aquimarinus]|uniref:Uncharacterized protein n=1 Tax=Polaribacter aquimarinus TaxID=2100726 RepID=A0A2U2JDJ8_9FLAO|nr:hypothetical protein DIS07_00890 [Polaribacter aquimarinus]